MPPKTLLLDIGVAQEVAAGARHFARRALDAEIIERGTLMNVISIYLGLLIALFTILLYKMRKPKPQIAGYGSQRMCSSCGLITSRLKACCLECGESLTAVSVTPILEK
jgi:hypothetical protein